VKSCADAHALLHYLICRAALEGNIGTAAIHVPLTEITDVEGPTFTADADNVVLKISVTTSWEAADDVEELFESDLELTEPEEEPEDGTGQGSGEGHRSDPDKNKGSH